MSTDVEDLAEALFYELAELPPEERSQALERACGDASGLRRRVERLLARADDVPNGFLEGDLEETPVADLGDTPSLGDFELLERIGEGGMGTVYAARQRSPRRDVAIKVVRAGRATPSAMRRFQFEIEVLGTLEHPGIARIYQAGTTEVEGVGGERHEVPYFVMELVRGTPLADYVRGRELGLKVRLELFLRVCDAVQHAHQRGVIHRDLKSENVLVDEEETTSSGRPQGLGRPVILDFGIARTLGASAEPGELETRAGDVLGSLSCMSPEQARGDPAGVDARADVYALGVLLFELAAGRPPLTLEGLALPDALNRIMDDEPPALGALDPALRGDLTVIAAKALEKDAARRYQSAFELAEDVRRHLDGRPIEARASSPFYVLRKELARHRVLVGAVAVTFLLLAAFAVVATRQARANRALADRERGTRAELEVALSANRIELGRLLGRTGNPSGEVLLWTEYLADPDSEPAYWALAEFYSAQPVLATRRVHEAEVRELIFHPDRTTLISADLEGTVRLSGPDDLRELGRLDDAPHGVFALALHPTSPVLVGGLADGSLVRWDLASGRIVQRSESHGSPVLDVEWFPDGSRLVAAAEDGPIWLWEPSSGEERVLRPSGTGKARCVAVAPDGSRIAASAGLDVHVLDAPFDGAPRLATSHRDRVHDVCFSPDGRHLFSGAMDQTIRTWDAETGEAAVWAELQDRVRRLWIEPETDVLYALAQWSTLTFDRRTGAALRPLPLANFTWAAATDPGGGRLAVGDRTGLVRLLDTRPTPGITSFRGEARTNSVALSPSGNELAFTDRLDRIRLFSADGSERATVPRDAGMVRHLAWHPTDPLLAWPHPDTLELIVWDLDRNETHCTLPPVSRLPTRSFAFHPDGRTIGTAGQDGRCHLFDLATGEEVLTLEAPGGDPDTIAFDPTGAHAAAVDPRRKVALVWALPGGELIRALGDESERPWAAAFSRDGRTLAVGTWERVVQLWDVGTGELTARLTGHEALVTDVCFLPGRPGILATSSSDLTVRMWSATSGRNLATFDLTRLGRPRALTPGRDGERLAVATGGTDAQVIDLGFLDRCIAGNRAYATAHFVDAAAGGATPIERSAR